MRGLYCDAIISVKIIPQTGEILSNNILRSLKDKPHFSLTESIWYSLYSSYLIFNVPLLSYHTVYSHGIKNFAEADQQVWITHTVDSTILLKYSNTIHLLLVTISLMNDSSVTPFCTLLSTGFPKFLERGERKKNHLPSTFFEQLYF